MGFNDDNLFASHDRQELLAGIFDPLTALEFLRLDGGAPPQPKVSSYDNDVMGGFLGVKPGNCLMRHCIRVSFKSKYGCRNAI